MDNVQVKEKYAEFVSTSGLIDVEKTIKAAAPHCTASAAQKDSSCCNNKAEKCGENEGGCDNDSHCKTGLKCGANNCPSGFPSNYDCCYKGIVYHAS